MSAIRWETLASFHVQRAAVKRFAWTRALDRLLLQARRHAPATLKEYRWPSILTAEALADSGPRTIELALKWFRADVVTVPIARRSSYVRALRQHCVERSECWAALLPNWQWDTPELAQLVADAAWRAMSRIGEEHLAVGEAAPPGHSRLRVPALERILRAFYEREGLFVPGKPRALLFPSKPRKGKRVEAGVQQRQTMGRLLKLVARDAGIEGISMHAHLTRHTFASARIRMVQNVNGRLVNVSTYDVAKELGHDAQRMIDKVYGHVLPGRYATTELDYDVTPTRSFAQCSTRVFASSRRLTTSPI